MALLKATIELRGVETTETGAASQMVTAMVKAVTPAEMPEAVSAISVPEMAAMAVVRLIAVMAGMSGGVMTGVAARKDRRDEHRGCECRNVPEPGFQCAVEHGAVPSVGP